MNILKKKITAVLCLIAALICVFAFSACNSDAKTYKIKFDLNYQDAISAPAEQTVKEGEKATRPNDPERTDYSFTGWFLSSSATGETYSFEQAVSADMTLFAGWKAEEESGTVTSTDYYLEAEKIDLSYVVGGDTSASPSGSSLIVSGDNAHGGLYIRALYVNELFLEFEFVSDKAVDDATITFAFAGEFKDFTLNSEELQIYVNPTLNDDYFPSDRTKKLKYSEISMKGNAKFTEYTVATSVSLKEGTNTIYLQVMNTESLAPTYSTMNAKAPMIDYVKINTAAVITQTVYDN